MRNGWFITIGEGTPHTARLVSWAMVLTVIGSEPSSWIRPSASCFGNTSVHECSPTSSGALKVNSAVSLACSACTTSSLVATTRPSGAVTLMVLPRRSHPEGQNTLTFKVTSVPASTSVAGGRLSATLVGCLCGSLFARSTSCFLLVSSSICGKEIVASGNLATVQKACSGIVVVRAFAGGKFRKKGLGNPRPFLAEPSGSSDLDAL